MRWAETDAAEFSQSVGDETAFGKNPCGQKHGQKSKQSHLSQDILPCSLAQAFSQLSGTKGASIEAIACQADQSSPENADKIACCLSIGDLPADLTTTSPGTNGRKEMESAQYVCTSCGNDVQVANCVAVEPLFDGNYQPLDNDFQLKRKQMLGFKEQGLSVGGSKAIIQTDETIKGVHCSGGQGKVHPKECRQHSVAPHGDGVEKDTELIQNNVANPEDAVEIEQVDFCGSSELAGRNAVRGVETRFPLPDLYLSQFVEEPVGSQKLESDTDCSRCGTSGSNMCL